MGDKSSTPTASGEQLLLFRRVQAALGKLPVSCTMHLLIGS